MIYPKGNSMTFPLELTQISESEEEDLKYLYPIQVMELQHMIENVCDQMEYDGSMMYDQYPDKLSICQMAKSVSDHYRTQGDQCGERGSVDPRWLEGTVEVMFCYEMNCRRQKRCSHKKRL